MNQIILGVHSNVAGDGNSLDSGHAWLTITKKKSTIFYGLWPDAHPSVVNNGDASDIRIGLELSAKSVANRYYSLNSSQTNLFNTLMNANVHWFYTNNCSSWASEIVQEVTGEDVDADDYFGIETPREIGRNILLLEKKEPTSFLLPKLLKKNPVTSMLSRPRK